MSTAILRRLEALEARSVRTAETLTIEQDAAWGRLFAAVRQGLREVHSAESISPYDVQLDVQLAALDERLKTGNVTAGDLDALAHLNHDDLMAANTTAAEVVDLMAEVSRSY